MTKQWMIAMAGVGLVLACACAKTSPEETKPPEGPSERPTLTAAECEAQGGTVVGDIGDGAIHRPDYVCESGQPPTATIRAAEGEPAAIEGAVCCPAAGS